MFKRTADNTADNTSDNTVNCSHSRLMQFIRHPNPNREQFEDYLKTCPNTVKESNAIQAAILRDRHGLIPSLIEHGADVNKHGYCGNTPLHWATDNSFDPNRESTINRSNRAETVQLLLRAGANPNVLNSYNESPIEYAFCSENPVIVSSLIEAGAATLNKKPNCGE